MARGRIEKMVNGKVEKGSKRERDIDENGSRMGPNCVRGASWDKTRNGYEVCGGLGKKRGPPREPWAPRGAPGGPHGALFFYLFICRCRCFVTNLRGATPTSWLSWLGR